MSKIAAIAKLTAQPGKGDELADALGAMVRGVEGEPGTEVYVLHRDAKDADTIWFYERYTDQAALEAHGSSDLMKTVGRAMAPLMAGRPELHLLSIVAGKGL